MKLQIFNYTPTKNKSKCLYCGDELPNMKGGRLYCRPCSKWQEGSWRQIIYNRDDGECFYCDIRLNKSNFTVDHVIPVSVKGRNIAGNMVCSCAKCNSEKGNHRIYNEIKYLRIIYERNFSCNIPNDLVMPIYRQAPRGWQREVSYRGEIGGKSEFRY